jgi:hypothetical protein
MNKKRIFFDFLQKHDALEAFKRAFKDQHSRNLHSSEYYPLSTAFIWAYTSDGHEYWKSLDDKWNAYYISIKGKYHF